MSEAVGWAAVTSAHSAAAADDRDITPVAVEGTGIAPDVAGSWDTADTVALPVVMGIPVVAETAVVAVAVG